MRPSKTKTSPSSDAIQESISDRLSRLVEATGALVVGIDRKGRITLFNRKCEEVSGYSRNKALGKSIYSLLIPKEERLKAKKHFQTLLEGNMSTQQLEVHWITKNGESRLLRLNNTYITDEQGRIVELFGIGTDLIEEKMAKASMRDSEKAYRVLYENLTEGFIIIDTKGLITTVNEAATRIFGYAKDEIIGKPIQEFLYPDDRQFALEIFQQAINTQTTASKGWALRGIHKDGSIVEFQITSSPILREGEVEGIQSVIRDISLEKQMEEALRESEDKYRSIVEQSLQGLAIFQDNKLAFVNQAITDILGYTSEEMMSFSLDEIRDILYPEDQERLWSRFGKQAKHEADSARYETRTLRKDGSIRWIEVYTNLITYQGKPATQAAIIDITERKNAEAAKEESESQYRTLVETSPDAITLTDLQGNILIANEQTLRLHGFKTIDELKGMSAFSLIAPEDQERALTNLKRTLETGSISNIEYTMLRKDGSRFSAELNAALLRGAKGEPRAFIGITRDLSERKAVESRLKSLFDHVPVGLYRTTPDGTILDANPALVEILGFSEKEQLLERKASSFYVDPAARRIWEATVAREAVVTGVQAEFRRKNGKKIWVEMNTRAIRDADGTVLFYEGSLKDITERKKAELEILTSQRRAEFLVDLMAHDLNNINQGIMLSLEILENDDSISEPTKEKVSSALAQVERSAELIGNVKRFQMLDAEPLSLSTRDLAPAFFAAVHAVERAFPQKTLLLTTNIQEKQYFVTCDGFLTELFFNLLHNALKADQSEIVKIEVHAEPKNGDSIIKVQIMDQGPGIPDSEKKRIFARYSERHEGVRGSGIGLTLVQRIINRYGGKIWVEDRVKGKYSQGANFVILLPRGEE